MENKEIELLKVIYNGDTKEFGGYVFGKNAYLTLQATNLLISMIENEYGRSYNEILNDLRKLNNGIKKGNKNENIK